MTVRLEHANLSVHDIAAQSAPRGGIQENTRVPNAHRYRTRLYFYDPEGNEWEFVEYLSDDPAKRNDYELPDR